MSVQNRQPPFLVSAADVKEEPLRWLWQPYFRLGALAVITGLEGSAKSTLAFGLAAMASTGRLPARPEPARALIVSREDDYPSFVVPRLLAAEADLPLIQFGLRMKNPLRFPRDLDGFERRVEDVDPRLIVLDPLAALIPRFGHPEICREALEGLTGIAERCNACILLIHHFNKGGSSVRSAMGGAAAVGGVPRETYVMGPEPPPSIESMYGAVERLERGDEPDDGRHQLEDEGDPTRVLAPHRISDVPKPPSLLFRIASRPTAHQESVPYVVLLGESQRTAEEVFHAARAAKPTEPPLVRQAAEFLLHYLAAGPKPTSETNKSAGDAGFTKRTLERARAALRVEAFQQDGRWFLKLPDLPDTPPEDWG